MGLRSIQVILLFLNFLHSHPRIKLKKKLIPTTVNMTVIEFLKYSSGWFAFTSDLSRFPFWIMLTFSVVYATIYIVYKFRFSGEMLRKNKYYFGTIAATVLVSYTLSLTSYTFALPLAILFAMSVALVVFSVAVGKRFKFMNWLWVEFAILPLVIIAFLALTIPFVEGSLTLGTWQQVIYVDFDNKSRQRELVVQVMGE